MLVMRKRLPMGNAIIYLHGKPPTTTTMMTITVKGDLFSSWSKITKEFEVDYPNGALPKSLPTYIQSRRSSHPRLFPWKPVHARVPSRRSGPFESNLQWPHHPNHWRRLSDSGGENIPGYFWGVGCKEEHHQNIAVYSNHSFLITPRVILSLPSPNYNFQDLARQDAKSQNWPTLSLLQISSLFPHISILFVPTPKKHPMTRSMATKYNSLIILSHHFHYPVPGLPTTTIPRFTNKNMGGCPIVLLDKIICMNSRNPRK